MLRVIKKTRIHEEVVTQIHELIREGRLKAGDQLPSERELAETFQVSRASVREALRALETHGLIISRTGMGNFIADLPVESLIAPLAKLLTEEKNALADIFELRKLIEPQIASMAAERATVNDIERMKRLLDVLSHSREESLQTAGRRQASIDSHLAILAAIEKHDEAKAREAMRYHIEQVEQNVLLSKKEKSATGHNTRRQIDPSVDLPLNKPEV